MGLLDSGNIDLNDPDMLKQLQALAAQMGPSEDDKKQALKHSLMSASLGLLANNNLPTAMGIGRAGLAGVGSYNDEIKQLGAQRSTNLSQAASALNTMKQAAISQYAMQMLNGTGGAPQPSPGQNAAGGMGAAMSAVGSPSAGIYDAMAQGAPQGQSQGGTQGGMPSRDAMAKMSLAFGLMKGDPTSAAKFMYPDAIAARPGAPIVNPIDGSVMNANAAPPPGFTYDPGSNSYKPVGGNEAFARMAGAEAGSRTAATEDAKNARDLIPVPMGDNTTQMMTKADAVAFFANRGKQVGGFPSPTPVQQAADAGMFPPSEMNAPHAPGFNVTIAPDGTVTQGRGSSPPGGVQPAGIGRTANPILQAGATAEAAGMGKVYADQQEQIDADAASAKMSKARGIEMRNLLPLVNPNLAAPQRLQFAQGLDALGFPKDLVEKAAGGNPAAMIAFGKQTVQQAFDNTAALTKRPAAAEVVMQVKSNPNLQMPPEAITAMLDYNDGIYQYKADKQTFKTDYVKANGTWNGGEAEFNKSHPIDGYVPTADAMRKSLGISAAPAGPLVKNQTALFKAQQAIKAGADPAAVRQRLIQTGVDPGGI